MLCVALLDGMATRWVIADWPIPTRHIAVLGFESDLIY